MPTGPLTDTEIAELRQNVKGWKEIRQPGPWTDVERVLDEVTERRARAGDHVAVMDIAHDYATVLRDWNARARAVLAELPPVGRGDQVTIPRELYEQLLALK